MQPVAANTQRNMNDINMKQDTAFILISPVRWASPATKAADAPASALNAALAQHRIIPSAVHCINPLNFSNMLLKGHARRTLLLKDNPVQPENLAKFGHYQSLWHALPSIFQRLLHPWL